MTLPVFDKALGTTNVNANSATVVLTTGLAAAVGSKIAVCVSYWDGGALNARASLSDSGGGAWARAAQLINGDDVYEVWWRDAPAGLASGQTITTTFSPAYSAGTNGGVLVSAFSFLNCQPGAAGVDSATGSNATTGTGYSSGSAVPSQAQSVLIGGAGSEATSTTVGGTITSGTKVHDVYNTTAQQGLVSAYKIVSSTASDAITGTFGATSTNTTGALMIFKGAADSTGSLDPQIQWTDDFGPGDFGPNPFIEEATPAPSAVVTALSDSDSGTGTDSGTVAATVPGSDTSTGTDTGTVSATASGSDSSTGTDTGSVAATVPGSDTGSGTETDSTSVTGSGSDTGSGSEGASTAVTLSGSDSATGTDAQVSLVVPIADSDTASGSEAGTVAASIPGADSATGSDSGTVSATVSGSDSGTATDSGTVDTGSTTPISGSDSGTGTEAGSIVITAAPVDAGGGSAEDFGDESTEDVRQITGSDSGVGHDWGLVLDVTPTAPVEPFRLRLPRRRSATDLGGYETGHGSETGHITVVAAGSDSGRSIEAAVVVDHAAEAEDEAMILRLLGVDL